MEEKRREEDKVRVEVVLVVEIRSDSLDSRRVGE